jgi:hypothetical protein
MRWQDSTLSLLKKYGPAAKAAARTLLAAALPDKADAVDLIGQPFGCFGRKARGWNLRKGAELQETEGDRTRLEQMLELLDGELAGVMAEVVDLPENRDGVRLVREWAARDGQVEAALARLAAAGQRLDRWRLRAARGREAFTSLPLNRGLRYGAWCLWVKDPGVGLLIVNPETGTFVRIWLGCNGWFEFRTARVTAGRVYTVWSAGGRSLDPGRYLDSLAGCGPPLWRLPEGAYAADQWNVEVHSTRMTLEHPATARVLAFERHSPVWDCNDVHWNQV